MRNFKNCYFSRIHIKCHLNAEVAAWVNHGPYIMPAVIKRVVGLGTSQTSGTIKTTNLETEMCIYLLIYNVKSKIFYFKCTHACISQYPYLYSQSLWHLKTPYFVFLYTCIILTSVIMTKLNQTELDQNFTRIKTIIYFYFSLLQKQKFKTPCFVCMYNTQS